MLLEYNGKKDEKEILDRAKTYEGLSLTGTDSYLFKGDNFIVLSKILNQYRSKIDMIYIDPPYNTNRVFKVSKDRSNTISSSNDGQIAYADNLTKEEYFEFMRERLIILRELLSEQGSIYLHIDCKVGHYIKILMDEIFGEENFKNDISRIKSNPKNFSRKAFGNQKDMILFYSKNYKKNIFNDIKEPLDEKEIIQRFEKQDENGERYTTVPIHAPGQTNNGSTGQEWEGMKPPEGRHWRYHPDKLTELNNKGYIEWSKTGNPRLKNYAKDHKGKKIQDIWEYKDPVNPVYPTEKNLDMLKMIIKQSSNQDSVVLDCFAGSGSTLVAAEYLNRKWIGIDSSEVAISVIKERLSNVNYRYLEMNLDNVIKEEVMIPKSKQLKFNI